MTVKLSSLRIASEFDASGYQRGMAAKVAADQQGIASSERLGAALASEDAAAGKTSRAVEAMSRAWITGYGHQAKFESGLRQINQALERGAVNTSRAAVLVEGLQRKFGQTADAVQVGQRGFTMLAPIVHEVNERLATQSVGLTKLTAANSNAVASTGQFTRASGLARYELVNLGRQVGDIGTMLAMGASPFQVLASQGAQVADIFTTTNATIGSVLRQIGGGALRFATSGAGLATGAGAILAAGTYSAMSYAAAQREVENALRGVGAASGVSLAGINRFAAAEAAAGKISTATAREIAAAFAGTGRVDPTKLSGLGGFTKEYATFTGLGIDDAMKELAAAFADPSRGAETLAGKIGGLNSAALRWISAQQSAGDLLAAQRTLLTTFQTQVEGSTERVGLFARAWDSVALAASRANTAVGRALNGPTDAERLASLQQQRDRLQQSPGLGVANQLRLLEAQIRPLEAIVELQRQREAIDARAAKAGNASLAASAIADQIDPYRRQLEELGALRTKLEEARKLNKGAPEYDEWGRALDRVKGAIGSLLPSVERERQAHDLTMRAISARTLAERTAVEVARETLRLSGEKVSAAEREAAALRKAAEVQAQANRDAQDALKASRDRLALAGKTPAERARIEIDQQYRDNVERFGADNTSLPQTTAAARGLDAAFAETLKRMMADIPGLSITSGFRTYDQQARLYAEKPGWAARPGTSNHERGIAADLAYNGSGQIPAWLREKIAAEYGVSFPLANRAVRPEPWHVEPNGGRRSGGVAQAGVAGTIRANSLSEIDLNGIENVLGNANRELERQKQLLALQANAWGQSSQEVARAAKVQELTNALQREGVAISPGLQAQIERTAAGYGELARQQEALRESQEALKTVGDLGRDVLRGVASDLRNGASGAEILRNALGRVSDKLLDMAMNDLFGKAFGNSGLGLSGFVGSFVRGFGGGGGLGMTPGAGGLYANGGVFGAGGVHAFAGGGIFTNSIVDRPTQFRFASGGALASGLMGEAGPEAIMPLRRGPDGRLGVSAPGHVQLPSHMSPPSNSNASGPVSVQIINKSSGQIQGNARTERGPDGSTQVFVEMVDAFEAAIASRAASGRSPLNDVFRRDANTMRG